MRRKKKPKKRAVLKPRACKKCHRVLTDPESIKLGIGPTCRAASDGSYQKELEKRGQLRLFE